MNENYENNKKNQITDKLEILPKNIRQIGDAGDGYRIYIEDYVYTYLHQYASEEKVIEQIAFLIGKQYLYNNEPVLLINGALKAKHLKKENGNLYISEKTWMSAFDDLKQYFNENKIVGWMYTQPGYGILLTSFLNEHHKKYFKEPKHVLYIIDPLEKEDGIFVLKENDLFEKKGYYIYYDKNQRMHQYILDNKVVKEEINDKNTEKDIIRTYRKREQQRKEEIYQKKFVNMITLAIGGLVCICLVLGIGLLSNMEKLNELQASMKSITENQIDFSKEGENKESSNVPTLIDNSENNEGKQRPNTVLDKDKIDTKIEEETNIEDNTEEESDLIGDIKPVINIPKEYIIKMGDNLNSISLIYYNTKEMVERIQELNGIDNPHRIYVGQRIILPQP